LCVILDDTFVGDLDNCSVSVTHRYVRINDITIIVVA